MVLSLVVSFHCIRLLICGMCDKRAFKAEFDNKAGLLKPLVKLTYGSIMCTCIPMLMAQVLLLIHYEISNWMWMLSLDSLLVTLFLVLLLVIDVISTEKTLTTMEIEKKLGKSFNNLIVPPENSLEDLVAQFPHWDFKNLVPHHLEWFRRRRVK